MTFAALVLTDSGGAAAADSLQTNLQVQQGRSAAGATLTIESKSVVKKVASSGTVLVAVAGYDRIGERSLTTQAHSLIARSSQETDLQSLDGFTRELLNEAADLYVPVQDSLVGLLGEGAVVWEAAVASRTEGGRVHAYRLTGHVHGGVLALEVEKVEAPLTGGSTVVVLGARHPDLSRYDYTYPTAYESEQLRAALLREPPPGEPLDLDLADTVLAANQTREAAGAHYLVRSAVATQDRADRPTGWPRGAAVAAAPIRVVTLNLETPQ